MKNTKLTLKSLQKELDLLKSNKAQMAAAASLAAEAHKKEELKKVESSDTSKSAIGHDIKHSYINSLVMKSSMMYLYLLSWIFLFINKMPYIKYIVTIMGAIYGRTTIWSLLIKIRKIFIIINALIGVYIVFKTTGFTSESFLANFVALGNSYIEILSNFTKKLFNWLLDILGYDIEPKFPKNKPLIKYNNPLDFYNPFNKHLDLNNKWATELYKPHNININFTPWYKDLSAWLWIGGIFGSLGLLYIGYSFLTNPTFLQDLFGNNTPGTGPFPYPDNDPNNIPYVQPEGIESPLNTILTFAYDSLNKLNPLNYLSNPFNNNVNVEAFYNQQDSYNYNKNFYPFTEINPTLPWYQRLRISLLGETFKEGIERLNVKRNVLNDLVPIALQDMRTGSLTPSVANVGIGIRHVSGSDFMEVIEASSSFRNTLHKVASLPSTPKFIPSQLPDFLINTHSDWND